MANEIAVTGPGGRVPESGPVNGVLFFGTDVLDHVEAQLAIELNASQGNPIVVLVEERVVSVANFEILPLAAALDYLRIVLATALASSAERTVKLLGAPWSGLPTGLTPVTESR